MGKSHASQYANFGSLLGFLSLVRKVKIQPLSGDLRDDEYIILINRFI